MDLMSLANLAARCLSQVPEELETALDAMGGLPAELATLVLRHAIESRRCTPGLLARCIKDEDGDRSVLRLTGCAFLTSKSVGQAAQPFLTTLVLGGVHLFDDVGLRTVAECAPRLQTLDVTNCWRLQDVSPLSNLTQLSNFVGSRCRRVSCWRALALESLRELSLVGCGSSAARSLPAICVRAQQLSTLKIGD